MDYEIRPSLFDRLRGSETSSNSASYYSMRQLRECVRRDLEALLNTRVRFLSPPPHLNQVQHSLIEYGVPDLAAQNLVAERGQREFVRWMERTIRYFEPRFKSVKVTPHIDIAAMTTLRFRVDAVLYADPAPETVVFDSVLDPITKTLSVSEARQ